MIYLDNAATTKPSQAAIKAANESFLTFFANPAALHNAGFEAEKEVEKARYKIAEAANVKSEEIIFTPGGTYSDNLAIMGYLKNKQTKTAITTPYEHPAVLECFKKLSMNILYLKDVTPQGLQKIITNDTVFVSVAHVNNQTGSIAPIEELARVAHDKNAIFHTDSVQGFMKEPFDYSKVDMASFSAHKIHGIKGSGALYVKKGLTLQPLIFGGGQEKGLISGTSNVPAIMAFSAALKQQDKSHVNKLYIKTVQGIENFGGEIIVSKQKSPFIISAIFKEYLGENIVHSLSDKGIYISTGSACSSKKPSTIMKALGLERYSKNVIRISFSDDNTMEEINLFLRELEITINNLIKI